MSLATRQRRLTELVPEHAVRLLGHAEHAHEEPHLIHVVTGAAYLTVDGDPVTLRTHESLWLAPDVPHAARYESGSLVLGPLLHDEDVPPVRVQRLGVVPAVVDVMTTILAVAPRTEEQIADLRTALGEVLRSLRAPHFALVVPTHPVAAAVAREARISSAPLDEIAARHGASSRHVQRLFTEQTGLPFHRWRVHARLNTAIARLRAGESMSRAARAAGYETRSGLLKALTREVEPSELRRLLSS
ncbi:AraC family transcriptional regulator [Aeromicrobium alkaliterrae]|uniref:Helix-turn-helix transcriptional regulator n=1 Tax=Aeromicrobium alkaliterrae TaxID=302168 RepID=A0ABP4W3T8_9ACTN